MGRHLEKPKNLNISTPSAPIANKISIFQKYKMVAAIFKIRKIAMSPEENNEF